MALAPSRTTRRSGEGRPETLATTVTCSEAAVDDAPQSSDVSQDLRGATGHAGTRQHRRHARAAGERPTPSRRRGVRCPPAPGAPDRRGVCQVAAWTTRAPTSDSVWSRRPAIPTTPDVARSTTAGSPSMDGSPSGTRPPTVTAAGCAAVPTRRTRWSSSSGRRSHSRVPRRRTTASSRPRSGCRACRRRGIRDGGTGEVGPSLIELGGMLTHQSAVRLPARTPVAPPLSEEHHG